MLQTTNIFGFNFICDTTHEALSNEIISDIQNKKITVSNFVTPNANFINVYNKYPALNSFSQSSRYILPDGQPIVWLSHFTKSRIKKRLTGSDFFPVMFQKLKSPQHKCLFVVSNESLKQKFLPEKSDASFIIPDFFEMHDEEKIISISEQMSKKIIEHKLNYVFIGISDPKQGALAFHTSNKLNALNHAEPCLFFFLGASFEFYFGLKKRAPAFFQKTGLEWFYRLIAEPKRMYKRYIFGNIAFIFKASKWLFTSKK